MQAKVWKIRKNGKYADLQGTWVSIYEDHKNERQITYSLTERSNLTDGSVFANITNDIFYTFRVRAKNEFGISEWSKNSRAMNINEILKRAQEWKMSDPPSSVGAMVGGAVTALALLCILVFLYMFLVGKGGGYSLKKLIAGGGIHGGTKIIGGSVVNENGHAPDMELANLSRSPIRTDVENPMYDVPSDEDLDKLPKVHRAQITLTQFLGSGAFGEVFEGLLKGTPNRVTFLDNNQTHTSRSAAHRSFVGPSNTNDNHGVVGREANADIPRQPNPLSTHVQSAVANVEQRKVAVKTLRKGASIQAKEDFLKEAKSMANFEHENIVELIGICLDNDPNFLILELMEGGDLLTYLRNCRPTSARQCSRLSLGDLVDMCLDVAKGCAYLESIHFVHRDIAARNCLIDPGKPDGRQNTSRRRKVKIGDFGLSRDIYKTDYYRVGGEVDKLLPVKWMAPESLSDGIFTSQSDVWAFGVLLWEIWTLGQQPYSAKTNHEVMVYVKERNTLDRPSMCPISLHSLMSRCWAFEPEQRPTFAECLAQIQELQVYKDELNDFCWHNSLSYVGSSGCSDRSSIASHPHINLFTQNTTTTGTILSSSASNVNRSSQHGVVPSRNENNLVNADGRRGRMEMHLRNGTGREVTTGSIDSWKTDGCNGDSGYTNRTSTTIPLNRNSINSSAASADFQHNPAATFNPPHTIPSQSSLVNNRLSSSPYIMPMPPGVHPNIEDVINSHHVLSSPNKNNICR